MLLAGSGSEEEETVGVGEGVGEGVRGSLVLREAPGSEAEGEDAGAEEAGAEDVGDAEDVLAAESADVVGVEDDAADAGGDTAEDDMAVVDGQRNGN